MKRLHKYGIAALAALSLVGIAITADALNQNSGSYWVKGILYAGTNKTALTDAAGTLAFSAGTSLTTSITAYAGGGAASATAITSDINVVTTCATAADSVILPAAASGRIMTVINSGAAALAVFPGSGDTINGGSADASITVPVNGMAQFTGLSASAWKSRAPYSVNGASEYTGATGTNKITFPDNLASGLEFFEGANSYLKLSSTNSAELAVFGVPVVNSVGAAVSAAGSSKTDATALTKEYNTITGTALQGVSLLTASAGLHQMVYNADRLSIGRWQ